MRPLLFSRRRILLLLLDAAVLALCYYLAFAVRLESPWPRSHLGVLAATLPHAVLAGLAGLVLAGVYLSLIRYTSTRDLLAIIRAGAYAGALLVAAVVFTHGLRRYPRSVFILYPLFATAAIAGSRLAWRLLVERREGGAARAAGRSVLIVGAGDAGDGLLRELRQNPRTAFQVVGFVDDDPGKRGRRVNGVEVAGGVDELPALAQALAAEEILIAIPSATGAQMRRIVASCRAAAVPYRTVPGLGDIIEGRVHVRQLRQVRIDDLLRRPPVRLDREAISAHLRGRRVLVTGAGGSIGAELCRQIARFAPERLVLLDHAENGLFHLDGELRGAFPWLAYDLAVADVTVAAQVRRVLERWRPHAVFHAAAHKHVPLMESNRHAAFANNVTGTRTVAEAAAAAGAARFVLISTDKAVNPTSAMGASKRVAELVVQCLAGAGGAATEFCSVRFGNVMGSAGSVIPLFAQQIAAGGPVTVTHPDAVRYFMTIPEAAQLVLQAGTLGRAGEIFLLDMGEPLRIADLARDMIRLSGLEPEVDVEIRYVGLRPGEKLSEELVTAGEGAAPTAHEKVMVLRAGLVADRAAVLASVRRVEELAAACAPEAELMEAVRALVPEYREALA